MNTIQTKLGRTGRMAAALVGLTALLGACANNTPTSASEAGSVPASAAPAAATPAAGAVSTPVGAAGALLGTSDAGDILVGPDGRALYGFTNDTAAASTCYSTCAAAWPPVIVSPDWTVGPGLDTGIFATTRRDDGQLQLVAGKWPLYYCTGDAVPGDINGQGSGDVWFLVDPEGTLIKEITAGSGGEDATATTAAGAPTGSGGYGAGTKGGTSTAKPATGALVGTARTSLGDVLADAKGLTLYGFTGDVGGKPSCYDACATAWPSVLVDSAELPAGLDPQVFSVVKRTDGTFQLEAGGWPLYRFGGDAASGDVNGQGSGGKWFAAGPDATLVKS
ncbi:MAG: hypothetical protein OEY41_01300 [Acidimicrobiia bacterium]|nr:hypothetical protein [Acidimicrobiia bacterium]